MIFYNKFLYLIKPLIQFKSLSYFTNQIKIDSDIDPYYITGLVQSDGSFFVTISKNKKSKFGIRIRPHFTVTQDLDSLFVL